VRSSTRYSRRETQHVWLVVVHMRVVGAGAASLQAVVKEIQTTCALYFTMTG
jgi:hypothetical protein